ncbi:class I SAM-dependent methyltransferase [Falsibacillus albus]|uniref:class I SAM-dependent methyltransferase n=1 Tax=Falsibacillus albus TaxID=2478915 RepID=UPI001313F610|nr:class I SAM-dependent methyltransferase [Falsibacillus albus]
MIESIYDQMNEWGKDDDFFVELVNKIKPESIADLGCGTGRLTLHLAGLGFEILGIDPDEKAIETAIKKDRKHMVQWEIGTSEDLTETTFDLVMMTSNVAQVFLKEACWNQVLSDIYHSLNGGGYLLFDARNPLQKPWENWTKYKTKKRIIDLSGKPMMVWYEFLEINSSLVAYQTVYQADNSIIDREENTLAFRTKEQIESALKIAGFTDINVYGDWEFKQAAEHANSFIFAAKK